MISQTSNFTAEFLENTARENCVTVSGMSPALYDLNFEAATGCKIYDLLFRDTDPTTNSSSGSAKAKYHYNKCELAGGFIVNGRFRQLIGPPIAFDKKHRPRKYSQPIGVALSLFFARVPIATWELVARKAGLSMPEFPVIGVGDEAIGFWEWVKHSECPIVVTEGEKKAACLLSYGYAAIGLPGIDTGKVVTKRGEWIEKADGTRYQRATARELRSELQEYDTPGRPWTFLFDYRTGDYSQSQEFRAACITAKLVKSAIAKIAILPGPDKGCDDFIVAGGDIAAVISEASQLSPDDWQKQKWHRMRGFSADRHINLKYFEADKPEPGKITAIKSGLATGKTEYIKRQVASEKNGIQINIGCRNSLLLQLSEKWGFYHLDEHNGYQFFGDPNARISLCFDSLLKLPIEMFTGATIIIDESASAINHLISSRTISDKRLDILERFNAIVKICDRIILSDGNLSDFVVNYIRSLSGKDCNKIENDFKGDTPPVYFLNPHRKAKEWLCREILNAECPAVATDSLRDAEGLALRLTEARGPGLLLSSKTAAEKWVKEFLKNPDKYISVNRPNWLVFTPTAESGLDISIHDYFSDVFCLFCGVVRCDEMIQMSRRVRHPERIVILCPNIGIGGKNKGGFFEAEIIKAYQLLQETEAQFLLADDEALQAFMDKALLQTKSPHTLLWAKLQCKAELERLHLRDFLIELFNIGGYSVQFFDHEDCTENSHSLARQETMDFEAQEIFEAEDISFAEASKIKQDYSATWLDRCKSIKCLLKARLPGIERSDLWNWEFVRRVRFEDRALLSQLDSSWQFENPIDAEFLQRSRWQAGTQVFLGDYSDRWLRIKSLNTLGMAKFLEAGTAWSQVDSEVQNFWELCHEKEIVDLWGYPGKMQPIQWLNFVLKAIGVKLHGKNVKQNGKQHREYSYTAELSRPENWDELMSFTVEKYGKKVSDLKTAEAVAVNDLEAVAPPPVYDQYLGVDATAKTEPETAANSDSEIANLTGWVQRWGRWYHAKVTGWCKAGTQYIVEAIDIGDFTEMLCWPDKLLWECPE